MKLYAEDNFNILEYNSKYLVYNQYGYWKIGTSKEECLSYVSSNKPKQAGSYSAKVVVLHITNKCNLCCDYCYLQSDRSSMKAFDLSVINGLIRFLQAREINHVTVVFHGGEPLLFPEVMLEVVSAFSKIHTLHVDYSVQTNGTIMSNELIEIIQKYSIRVSISLDGYKSIHDLYRVTPDGKGSFDKIQETINVLREHSIIFAVNSVLTTSVSADKLLDFYIDSNISHFKLVPVYAPNNDMLKLSSIYNEFIMLLVKHNLQNDYHLEEGNFKSFMSRLIGRKSRLICDNGNCINESSILMVDANGDIYPCEEFIGYQDMIMHNVHSIEVSMQKKTISNYLDSCSECILRPFCGGICPRQLIDNDYSYCKFRKMSIINYLKIIMDNTGDIVKLL